MRRQYDREQADSGSDRILADRFKSRLGISTGILASGQDLHWALFLGHLACEKALKALVVKHTWDYAPRTHNLLRLAELAGLSLSEEQVELLGAINQFNLNVRYPDEQYEFYRRCTPEFAKNYMKRMEGLRKWLLQML